MTAPANDIHPDPAGALAEALTGLGKALEAGHAPDVAQLSTTRAALLAERFSLSGAETLWVGLLAGAALSPAFGAALADWMESQRQPPLADLGPRGTLRAWYIVQGAGERGVLDPRILDWLRGRQGIDTRLGPWCVELRPAERLMPRHADSARDLVQRMLSAPGAFAVTGAGRATRAALARDTARHLDMVPLGLDPAIFTEHPERRAIILRLVARETVLDRVLPVFQVGRLDHDFALDLHRLEVPSLTLAADASGLDPSAPPVIHLETPDLKERAELWRSALKLPSTEPALPLAEAFVLETDEIAAIASRVGPTADRVAGARSEAVRALRPVSDPLVRAIDPVASWSDLVLPPQTDASLRAIAAQARNRSRVHGEWGFGSTGARGLGLTALFHGPSGTGKTLAAEVIAHELGLGLLRVDLSQIVDKFVGETEKHLDRVFALAERSGAVLLFDEAEALFRQRGDDDAGARHFVSMTVSYLLQRIETCAGTCLLTTNMRSAIDTAFLRRLRFVLSFPFPSLPERRRLWRSAMPAAAPTSDIDFDRLAALPAAGGTIRNVMLNAAFLAADRSTPIGMEHILAALELENAKLDQPIELGALRRRAVR